MQRNIQKNLLFNSGGYIPIIKLIFKHDWLEFKRSTICLQAGVVLGGFLRFLETPY